MSEAQTDSVPDEHKGTETSYEAVHNRCLFHMPHLSPSKLQSKISPISNTSFCSRSDYTNAGR
jgi:hypothetical protein